MGWGRFSAAAGWVSFAPQLPQKALPASMRSPSGNFPPCARPLRPEIGNHPRRQSRLRGWKRARMGRTADRPAAAPPGSHLRTGAAVPLGGCRWKSHPPPPPCGSRTPGPPGAGRPAAGQQLFVGRKIDQHIPGGKGIGRDSRVLGKQRCGRLGQAEAGATAQDTERADAVQRFFGLPLLIRQGLGSPGQSVKMMTMLMIGFFIIVMRAIASMQS